LAGWHPMPVLHLTPPPSRTRSANTVTPSYTGPALEPRDVQALAPFGLFTLPYGCLASIAPTG